MIWWQGSVAVFNLKKSQTVKLLELLDQERAAILAGHLHRLPQFADRKTQAIEALRAELDEGFQNVRSELVRHLGRNAKLLAATAEGVASARKFLISLRQTRRHQTYSAAGQRQHLTAASGTMERKA
jgi:hypothetical protein